MQYPTSCTSAFCGRTECPEDCPHLAAKDAFYTWREATKAFRPDPIWLPGIWEPADGEREK